MILLVSHAADEHVPPVEAALRRLGADHRLLDVADLPRLMRVSLATGRGLDGWWLTLPSGERLRAADVTAVWWRRPQMPRVAAALSFADAGFATREWEELLAGFWAGLRARWVNDPWAYLRAAGKASQLLEAEAEGLLVPSTLITSDAGAARDFLEGLGGPAIRKAFWGRAPGDWTRLVGRDDPGRLAADLAMAPVTLQAYVPGVDVRVTALGARLFATAIDARGSAHPEDFRPGFDTAEVSAAELPPEVEGALRRIMTRHGLAYGAFDLRRAEDGRWFFLELNPAGQWLFCELRTGQPIAAALADLLAAP